MKKFALLSIVAAALLFVGCEKKEHQTTQNVEKKSVEQKSVKSVAAHSAQAAVKKEGKKIEEPLPGVPMPPKSSQSTTASQQPVAQKVEKTVQEVKQEAMKQVNEAAKEVKQAAQAATQEAKKTVAAILPGAGAVAAGNSAEGKKIFAKCASCHGSDGKRKALGKSAPIAGMPKDEVIKKLKGYKAGTLNQYGMGALMKSQAAPLSDSEIEALAAYISSLK